ncbi:hypothetical protein ACGF07_31965 [Kitasatospora sp. NPDC048194]|uniref:hypothetical protein n=1 Tax=Kitasatospora sp. NPDC048194 TaxID=3364045 RepID=UPI0037207720
MTQTHPQPVDVRLIGGEIAVRALAESIAATPGSTPASYAPSRKGSGLRAYLSVVVDPAALVQPADPEPKVSPTAKADQAKRRRDLGGELGALVHGERALRTAPWAPPQVGDVLHVHFEGSGAMPEFGETYLVERDEWGGLALRLLALTPDAPRSAGAFAGPDPDDPLFTPWMEAGPHRLTLVRNGRVVHDGPNTL